MIKKSTFQLLRFPFSWFLMPVFWFALSFSDSIDLYSSLLCFCILHLLVYPSSNGYNSYMDRDTSSIGGIKHPPAPHRQLFLITLIMDEMAIVLSLFLSPLVAVLLFLYITCSRLYSYRGVRLKKYPIIGYITVILNQGGIIFFIVYLSAGNGNIYTFPYIGCITACFLIGGFYPMTQIYQHDSDRSDDVTTLSMLLGKKGTFLFCGLMYLIAFGILFIFFNQQNQMLQFGVLLIFFLPVILFFLTWAINVWRNPVKANFENTMQMNWLASTCASLAFITLILLKYFD